MKVKITKRIPRAAMPGSLVQRSFGEEPTKHGYLFWDLPAKKATEVDIANDYSFHNFYVEEPDYTTLTTNSRLTTNVITPVMHLKVHWQDYSANINLEHEMALRHTLATKYGVDAGKIKFKKLHIYQNVVSSQRLTEALNIQDKETQQEIFREYLLANKYDEAFIEEILTIDDLITSRLQLNTGSHNIEWSLPRLWVENFKSYGEAEIDFSALHGLVQIHGENQQGKTTLFDAICYILFGTTLATNKLGGAKQEKHGDARFINNARLLDHCAGGCLLNASGQLYTLIRRTERTWGKGKKTISGVSTELDIYLGAEIKEECKLKGERKEQTQAILNNILGTFEDFVRLSLTNSENLNNLLSMDRATFMDAIIRDAGYDIFEKKLEEFKEYKKEQKDERISLDLTRAETDVLAYKQQLHTYKAAADQIQLEINADEVLIGSVNERRDLKFQDLHPIDEEVAAINVDKSWAQMEDYRTHINANRETINTNQERAKSLCTTYDASLLESSLKAGQKLEDDNLNLKLKISQVETTIEKANSTIKLAENQRQQLISGALLERSQKIKDLRFEIEKTEATLGTWCEKLAMQIRAAQREAEFEGQTLQAELGTIKEKGVTIKKQIKELEESKICPTCQREYDSDHQEHIATKIADLNAQIAQLMAQVKPKQTRIKELETHILTLKAEQDALQQGTYTSREYDQELYRVEQAVLGIKNQIAAQEQAQAEIKAGVYSLELQTQLSATTTAQEQAQSKIEAYTTNIANYKQTIKAHLQEKIELQGVILRLETAREEVVLYTKLLTENKELLLKEENIKLTIENAKNKLDKYYAQLEKIEANKEIQALIKTLEQEREGYEHTKKGRQVQMQGVYSEAGVVKNAIKELQERMVKYKYQVQRDALLKEYEKCVHRDGIPSFLLKKSIHLLNAELANLLTEVDFVVYFNDDLQLKMSPLSRLQVVQNALEGSGKERTFIAIALKLALRSINYHSKPNFILFDEIMTKLVGESVDEFQTFLENAKKKIDLILIVEHIHPVEYNALIDVRKNNQGVSSLTITG